MAKILIVKHCKEFYSYLFHFLIDDADEDDEEDGVGNGEDSDDGRDYSWKKTIMIGPSYQASVPGGLSAYGDTLPYGNCKYFLFH